eukprot:3517699-Rhodomonas_salina.1
MSEFARIPAKDLQSVTSTVAKGSRLQAPEPEVATCPQLSAVSRSDLPHRGCHGRWRCSVHRFGQGRASARRVLADVYWQNRYRYISLPKPKLPLPHSLVLALSCTTKQPDSHSCPGHWTRCV